MTDWITINNIVADFNRATQGIIATFQGRQRTVSTFFGVSGNNLVVQFLDQSSSQHGAIVSWSWTFGDGQTSTQQNPLHTYAVAGDYLVTLVSTDATGAAGSFSAIVTAEEEADPPPQDDPGLPIAKFSYAPAGLVATFTDLSTDSNGTTIPAGWGSIVAWDWDFGQGPDANFTAALSTLTLTLTDTSTVPAPETINGWNWDLGDGSHSSSQNTVHKYAAGGSYNVNLTVSATNGLLDSKSSSITITSGVSLGIPFGPTQAFISTSAIDTRGSDTFDLFMDGVSSSQITARIAAAAANGWKLLLNMTGGSHTDYLTNGVFDPSKWTAKQNTFNTQAIKDSVISACSAGVVVGCSVMDEPFHPSWGPSGTMTKAKVDAMAAYVKTLFPNMPCGVAHGYQQFFPNSSYTRIDFIISNYQFLFSNATVWRDSTLAMCSRDGHNVLFGLNPVAGGPKISGCFTSNAVCCPGGTASNDTSTSGNWTGQVGAGSILCGMNPSQVSRLGYLLCPSSTGLMMWRYDLEMMSTSTWAADFQKSFRSIASLCATLPRKSWLRAG